MPTTFARCTSARSRRASHARHRSLYVAPDRIAAAALLVPAGFVTPSIVPLLRRVVAPMLAYLARLFEDASEPAGGDP